MKSKFLFLSVLLSLNLYAFDKDFKTVNDRVPYEFNLLFNSMKIEVKSPLEKIKLVGLCQELNENLGFLNKEHIFLLMKSEVIKNILEHKFSKVRQFDVTLLLIDRLNKTYSEKEKYLNPFSKSIWLSVLAELNYRKSLGIITNSSYNPRVFSGEKLTEALRFEKYLKYLLPWIDKMDSLGAPEFNDLTKEISWTILRRLNDRSLLFKRFASTAAGETKITLFNIPQKLLDLHPEDIKKIQTEEPTETLQEASDKEKSKAQSEVDQLSPEDLSPMSDDLARELEKKTETTP